MEGYFWNAILCFLLFVFVSPFLAAATMDNSASANALSGITILSTSPADYLISPLIGTTGICLSWQQPYGINNLNLYGLHSAFPIRPVILATGIAYLDHPDYRWQDEYLALSASFSGLRLGITQHLIYEKIEAESWLTWYNDFALAYQKKGWGAEIRGNNIQTEDFALTFSGSIPANETTLISPAYTFREKAKDSYCLATSFIIAKPLSLQCSWQNEPARFGLGMKVLIGNINVMYAVRTHTELGLTHIVDLGSAW